MFRLKYAPDCAPQYMTAKSAAADLKSRISTIIPPGKTLKIPTGVWIESVDWKKVPNGTIPEIQIRARSSIAFKRNVMLANGVGTVDADYPDEICVLLYNNGPQSFPINKGDRLAQMAVNLVARLPDVKVGGERTGGFGSTDKPAAKAKVKSRPKSKSKPQRTKKK
jgi:dUTP pyrophosphatase